MKNLIYFLCLIFFIGASSQEVEDFCGKAKIHFERIADLIILNADINGYKNLKLIFDTGSNGVILFDEKYFDRVQLKNAQSISMRGLGADTVIAGKFIKNNQLSLSKNLNFKNVDTYLITDRSVNLGAKFGTDIHGIIGNDLFRQFIVHINYTQQKLILANTAIKKNKYEEIPMVTYNRKPFLRIKNKDRIYTLLMDSGGSDALWLFDSDVKWETTPHIRDFLGFGLSGEVIGRRMRKDSIYFGNQYFEKMYVAVPDAKYTDFIKNIYPKRDGSVGMEFIKRYNWIIDYKRQKIYYKPNRKIKEKFSYNVTGIEVFQPIREINFFVIESILLNSLADEAGIYPDDVILSINGISSKNLTLESIYSILENNTAKKMTITVDRNGHRLYFDIPIADILNQDNQ